MKRKLIKALVVLILLAREGLLISLSDEAAK